MLSFSALVLYLLSSPLESQEPRSLAIPTVEASIVIDGNLDAHEYSQAAALNQFSIYRPTTKALPKFKVHGKVLATSRALYFGFVVDTGGTPLYAPRKPRDSRQKSDKIQIELSPYQAARRAYTFELTAGETLRDGIKNEMGRTDRSWDSLFDGRIQETSTGFTAEIKIPFQSLRFDAKQNTWGLHIFIHSRYHQQSLSWVALDPNLNNWLRQMGHITGLAGKEPGRALEVLPSITAGTSTEDPTEATSSCSSPTFKFGSIETCQSALNYGLGLKWGITPSLTLDGVFNPDFSQIESDAAQLTLNNRFALYYPERRPFFMEGNDIFDTPLRIMYTRSINQPTGALKLTGKVGDTRVGFLTASDPTPPDSVLDENFSPSVLEDSTKIRANTSVGRMQLDLGSNASLGGFILHKSFTHSGNTIGHNLVGGIDGQAFATDNLSIESSIFGSKSKNFLNTRLDGIAHRTRAVWKNDSFRLQSHYQHVSSKFRSEAGFIPRTGYHNAFIKADGYYYSENNWGRNISPGLYAGYYWNESGEIIERTIGGNTWWLFGGHIYLFSSYERIAERYEGRLEQHQGQWFDGNYVEISTGSSTLHWLKLKASIAFGDTLLRGSVGDISEQPQGWMEDIYLEASVLPTTWIEVGVEVKQRSIKSAYKGRTLDKQPILRARGRIFFNRDIYLRYLGQWNPNNSEATNDVLFSYVPSPGTVVFLGFQDKRAQDISPKTGIQTYFLKLSTNLVY